MSADDGSPSRAAADRSRFTAAEVVTRLRAAGCVFAEDEAAILLQDAVGDDQLEARIRRREGGEPLEYIVGWTEFRGLRVTVAPGVFVPRQRTTALVREALRLAPPAPTILDLCCGAGAIGAAILAERPDAVILAADIDPAAVECARTTLAEVAASATRGPAAGGSVSSRFAVYAGDLYDPLPRNARGSIDLLVVNAPYVPTDEIAFMPSEARDHEARAALDGGPDGLALQRRVANGALEWLVPGGYLLIETSRRQASRTAEILEGVGFATSIVRDEDVMATIVVGRAPASALDRAHKSDG